MPTPKRPRRKYRPREARLPSVFRHTESEETQLQLVPHVALELFRTGTATEGDWHTLACRINWGMVLATRHHPEAVEVATAGVVALRDVFARHARTGRWGCSGEELRAIGAALVLVDDMQMAHTRRELLDALHHTLRVAGRAAPTGELMEAAL
jgi:hypothetical protein